MREGERWSVALERQAATVQSHINAIIRLYGEAADMTAAAEALHEEHGIYLVLLEHAPEWVVTEHAARYLNTGA